MVIDLSEMLDLDSSRMMLIGVLVLRFPVKELLFVFIWLLAAGLVCIFGGFRFVWDLIFLTPIA